MKKTNRQKIIRKLAIIIPLILIILAIGIFVFRNKIKAEISDPSEIVTQTGLTYQSTLDNLAMKMDASYDPQNSHAPIILVLHGYSGPFVGTDILRRLAAKGAFAIKTYKRGFGDSEGTSDDSARESRDFVDAIEYVKANFPQYVDPENINVIGYSGGGGNAYSLIGKFPDYFRSANIFFGMSDYGYDKTYGWYYNGAGGGEQRTGVKDYRPMIEGRIGGSPDAVPNNYFARDMVLSAKNNPSTKINLFYDSEEKICPITHAEQFLNVYRQAGFSNANLYISDENTTTTELIDGFDSTPEDWVLKGVDPRLIKQISSKLYFTTKSNSAEDIYFKKFTSLRKYSTSDNLYAQFQFRVYSAQNGSAAIIGFRNGDDTVLKNSLGILITPSQSQPRLYLRTDYNGTPLTSGNRSLKLFDTVLEIGKTYAISLNINNNVLSATIKGSGSINETQSLPIDKNKFSQQVDSFAISSYHSGSGAQLNGWIDSLKVYTYSRWYHAMPQEATGKGENDIVAENYFVPDIVAGNYPMPVLRNNSSMFIAGYIVAKPFEIMLDEGQTKAGELEYDISGDTSSYDTAKIFKIKSLSGQSNLKLTVKNLQPNQAYTVEKSDGINPQETQIINSDGNGVLSLSSIIDDTLTYRIYLSSTSTPTPEPSSTETSSPIS